jgi:hypothetical protein
MDWVQLLTAGGAFTALGIAAAAYLRTRPAMKHAETEAEAPLWERIGALEASAKGEREECQRRVGMLEAHVSDLEHDLANEQANLDSFLLLATVSPDKLAEMIPELREQRQRHKERKALKRGAREGALIAGTEVGNL